MIYILFVEHKYCSEKITLYKKDDRSSHQNSVKVPHFYCKQRNRFVFQHLTLKKSLESFVT